jgi:hypothetical protein
MKRPRGKRAKRTGHEAIQRVAADVERDVTKKPGACDSPAMGPNQDDGKTPKKGDDNGGKGEGGGKPDETPAGPLDLSKLGFGGLVGRDDPGAAPQPRPPKGPFKEKPLTPEQERDVEEAEQWLQEFREEFGLEPFDRSKTVEGPPLTPEDHQAIIRFDDGRSDREEWIRVDANIRRFTNWYDAWREAAMDALRQWGESERGRN